MSYNYVVAKNVIVIVTSYFSSMPKFSNLPPRITTINKSTIRLARSGQATSSKASQPNLPNMVTSPLSQATSQRLQDSARQTYQQSLTQTIEQRRRLRAAEYSTKNPIQDNAKQRGQLLERRIGQLQQQLKSSS